MKTVTITEKGQIVLPKDVRVGNFKEGAKLCLIAYKDRIMLLPMKFFDEKWFTVLASEKSLAKDWLKKEEDEAWKDL